MSKRELAKIAREIREIKAELSMTSGFTYGDDGLDKIVSTMIAEGLSENEAVAFLDKFEDALELGAGLFGERAFDKFVKGLPSWMRKKKSVALMEDYFMDYLYE